MSASTVADVVAPGAIDDKDVDLLRALQANARVRLEELGRHVGLAPSSVFDRLRRLERMGVISRWTVDVDPRAFGLGTMALVGIRSSLACSALVDALEAMPDVEECHSVAGEFSLIVKVRVRSPEALLAFVEKLRVVPGIEDTRSTVSLKTHFERGIRPRRLV